MIVLEDLFGLRFNFQIGTMYAKLEMYYICKWQSVQNDFDAKNRSDNSAMWMLGPSSFRVIGILELKM